MVEQRDVAEVLNDYFEEKIATQQWYQRFSNTVTTAIGGLVTLAWWLTTLQTDFPTAVDWSVGAVLFLGQVIGVTRTHNGITPSVAATVTAEAPRKA